MRIEFVGGPLDGSVDEVDSETFGESPGPLLVVKLIDGRRFGYGSREFVTRYTDEAQVEFITGGGRCSCLGCRWRRRLQSAARVAEPLFWTSVGMTIAALLAGIFMR